MLLGALAATLAACHTTRVVWSKPGADQAALQGDLQACADQARVALPDVSDNRGAAAAMSTPSVRPESSNYFGGASAPATTDTEQYAARDAARDTVTEALRPQVKCMIAHGWRLTPQP
ncbi:MAG: hypothetical protein ACREEN_01355 [Stellaceae bacterium]